MFLDSFGLILGYVVGRLVIIIIIIIIIIILIIIIIIIIIIIFFFFHIRPIRKESPQWYHDHYWSSSVISTKFSLISL